ncbi:MAG: HU family DNA-binding protein [Desulfomonile tiedjei]|nr:HU family DNA-binding protein [Desulfomonile tiedjei]
MTKADLVSRMAKDAGISQKAADAALTAIVGAIHQVLKGSEGQVRIADLGTFKTSKRSARIGVNPRSGAKITIPATVVPTFSAAKALKDSAKG